MASLRILECWRVVGGLEQGAGAVGAALTRTTPAGPHKNPPHRRPALRAVWTENRTLKIGSSTTNSPVLGSEQAPEPFPI